MRDGDLLLFGGLLGSSFLLLGAAMSMDTYRLRARPTGEGPAPAPPAALPAPAAPPTLDAPRVCSPQHYQESVRSAMLAYQLPRTPLEALRRPLRGGVEFKGRRVLSGANHQMKTAHLQVESSISDLEPPGGAEAVPHLTLLIKNLSDAPVAYRVVTQVNRPRGCDAKHELPHNALVLKPHQTVQRTECVADGRKLTVTLIEAYEVSRVGQVFLSRLQPAPGGPFDLRVAAAHDRGGLPPCAAQGDEAPGPRKDAWRRWIDFYARHNCDEYHLPAGYRPWDQPGELPACDRSPRAER